MALFRVLNRHFSRAPPSQCIPTVLLHRRLKCVARRYNHAIHDSNSFASSAALRSLYAVVTRLPCRSQCISSSAAPFASAGAGNGGFGGDSGGGGGDGNGGAGGDSGDANPKLVGEAAAKELLALSPDVIILDVEVWTPLSAYCVFSEVLFFFFLFLNDFLLYLVGNGVRRMCC